MAHISSPNIENWQVLFILEGLLTIVFGISCIWILPDRPHNTKWLTPRERDVADWRMLRDGNRTHGKVHWKVAFAQLLDWRLWANIAIYMCQVRLAWFDLYVRPVWGSLNGLPLFPFLYMYIYTPIDRPQDTLLIS